uniref:LSDAT_euk domain-containing protein n=1 Tax=Macrostomum lignano TaxID=282301 RepID=A0A1I8H0Q3_9PLAT
MSRVGNLPMESLSVSVGGPSSSVSRNRTELRSNSSGGIRQLSASAYPGSPTGWELGRRPSVVFGESETTEELAKTRFMRSNKQQKKHEERMDKNRQAVEDQLREFMKRHFHRKECCLFEEKDAGKCACGEVRDKHDRQFLQTGSTEKWAAEKHLQKVGATNAFGRIRLMNEGFDNHLMKTHWKMSEPQQPSLCISVIGGAKNFKLEGRKKEVFHHGLIRAAQTTNAWIITSGLNLGITRVVGNALEEGRASHWEKASRSSKLRCIGVAPWGYVLNKDDLVNKESPGGQFSLDVEYKISSVLGKGQPVSLNANHTHYLLVDDGKRNRYGGSKSSVIKAQLQKQINVTEKIPVVLLIVEGGFDIFEEMESMISANIPITLTEAHRADLLNRIKEAFGDNLRDPRTKEVSPAKMEEMLQTLLKLVSNEKLITVFDMNRSDDLDLAILSALLKVMDAKQLEDYKRQLNLSLTWNRSDIAAEKIFTEELQWDTASLEDFTLQAIKEDKMDFLKLFLNNGLIMKEFLTVKQLRNLYRSHLKAGDKNPATVQIRKLLGSRARCKSAESVRLSSIRLLLRRLIGKFQSPDMDEDVGGRDEPPNDAVDGRQLDRPFNQLFFWAVLSAGRRWLGSSGRELMKLCRWLWRPARFLACNSSQNSVNRRWLNGLLHGTSNLSILACVLLPFLLPSDRVLQAEPDAIEDALSDSGGGVDSGGDGGSGGGAVSGSACSRLCICYVFFLLFYSYFILFSLKQAYMTWLEWLVMAWVWVMIIDEIREMFSSKADTVREKLHDWWNFSVWNRLDLVTILLTLLGMFMRIPDSTDSIFLGIRTCYILAGVFFYLRVFRLYYVNSYLGPKLVMINKMVKELLFYLSILLIPLLTYADPPSGCSGNSTVDDQGNPCPTAGALVLILLAVYLMVVDILLLNLLIAIFSNIFEEIERNAIEIWKYNMYFLVQEYHNKPVLALPFVVFEDFFIFGRMLFNKISCKKKPDEGHLRWVGLPRKQYKFTSF